MYAEAIPRSSFSRSSISRSSSRPKTSTIKSGTTKLKPSTTNSVPRVNNNKTKSANTNKTSKATTKVDSASGFKTKPNSAKNTNKTDIKSNQKKYYLEKPKNTQTKSYISSSYYNNHNNYYGLSFWDYCVLNNINNRLGNNNKVSERDIAKALEEKGYSKEQIKEILNGLEKEHQEKIKNTTKKTIRKIIAVICGGLISIAAFMFIFRKDSIELGGN